MKFLTRTALAVMTFLALPSQSMEAVTGDPLRPDPRLAAHQRFQIMEQRCLADAIYFEARGEDTTGKVLVAEVVLNRRDHPAFPKSICGVIREAGAFPWFRKPPVEDFDLEAYQGAVEVAGGLMRSEIERKHRTILWFHNPKTASKAHLREKWRKKTKLALRHGRHDFMEPKGERRERV